MLTKQGINRMKKLSIISASTAFIAVAGFLLIPAIVSAQGGNGSGNGNGYEQAVTTKAQILKMTTDELKTQLKTKTMDQIIESKGLTEDQFHEKMGAAAEARWKDRGLSTEEIAKRQAARSENQGDCDGTGTGGGVRYGANR
jgi:hypothetical protein